jgi:hypothetical protein
METIENYIKKLEGMYLNAYTLGITNGNLGNNLINSVLMNFF